MEKIKTYEMTGKKLLLVTWFYGVAAIVCLIVDITPLDNMFLGAMAGMFSLWLYVSWKVKKIGKL